MSKLIKEDFYDELDSTDIIGSVDEIETSSGNFVMVVKFQQPLTAFTATLTPK